MRLHTVFVTYNRLELTKRTLASYLETVSGEHTFCVVDNASTDGTQKWLLNEFDDGVHLLSQNSYPGFSTNRGWERAPTDATHLHRSDNDVEYLPGWCDEVLERFEDPQLGQLGLRTVEEEGARGNVGGNCIIPRSLFDQGLRYDESPWTQVAFEDGEFSYHVRRRNLKVGRVQRPCVIHIGIASITDPYYQQTFADRRITFEQWGVK